MTLLRSFTFAAIVFLCALLAPIRSGTEAQSSATLAQTERGTQRHAGSVITDANLTFTTIDVPGAVYTNPNGINAAGDVVGNYGQNANTDSHGFLYSNGTFTYFDYPGAYATVAFGINDSSLIVGEAEFQGGAGYEGFL